MSSLVLTGNTSGTVTLAAPAVAGTNTLTLPASTGSVIASDASANIQFNSGFGSVATAYGCRAWVNFNGTGTVAIRASGNVTNIFDNGTGDYTVNFTTAMPDANYSAVSTAVAVASVNFQSPLVDAPLVGSCRFYTSSASATDSPTVCVAVFR